MSKLPKVFVGSSKEAKEIVKQFCKALEEDATMVRWWQASDFKPMTSTLEGLWKATLHYDFGLFILTPDDLIKSRDQESYTTRDNVLFELGLFLGRLGLERTFAVIQQTTGTEMKVKILSDLAGQTMPRYTKGDKDEQMASIANAADDIGSLIRERGRRKPQICNLAKAWTYDKENNFSMTLSAMIIQQHIEELQDKQFVVIARKRDQKEHFDKDTRIAHGTPRGISIYDKDDLILHASCKDVLDDIKRGNIIEGHLLLIPKDVDVKNVQSAKTISEMIDIGCDLLESVGTRVKSTGRTADEPKHK